MQEEIEKHPSLVNDRSFSCRPRATEKKCSTAVAKAPART